MKRLLILSGKGGTGKTTTAAAFVHFSQAKAVADCDVDAPNLQLVLEQSATPEISAFSGGEKAVIDQEKCIACGLCRTHCRFNAIGKEQGSYTVNEYACEGCGVCAFVCPNGAVTLHTDTAGEKSLYLGDGVFSTATLKMGRGNSGKLVTEVKLAMLKNAPETPLSIIDGSPGIGCPVMASISGMDMVLMVAEPSLSGLSDLKRLVKTARSFQVKLAVCVNKWDISPDNTQKIRQFCAEQEIPYLGQIPYDKSAAAAINAGCSVGQLDCPARSALQGIYEKTIKLINT